MIALILGHDHGIRHNFYELVVTNLSLNPPLSGDEPAMSAKHSQEERFLVSQLCYEKDFPCFWSKMKWPVPIFEWQGSKVFLS